MVISFLNFLLKVFLFIDVLNVHNVQKYVKLLRSCNKSQLKTILNHFKTGASSEAFLE